MRSTFTGDKKHAVLELLRSGDPDGARKIQEGLRHHSILERTIDLCDIRSVAGADAAYAGNSIYAAVVVMSFPRLAVVETASAREEIPFPYIPGLFSFREGPAIADVFTDLVRVPDLLILNGHGYAHPERMGIASHLGIVLDIPAIGVARHLLTGTCALPGITRGSAEPVSDRNEVIGMAVRTVTGAKPVFVSAGHKIDLPQAVDIALKTTRDHRMTEPIWHADQLARQCRKEEMSV